MKNLTGIRFGRLVPITFEKVKNGIKWFCQCDCGNNKLIASGSLLAGRTKSCGCLQKEIVKAKLKDRFVKDLRQQRFGRLIALEPLEKRIRGGVCWLCQCDCGNRIECNASDLQRHPNKSCGCLKKEQAKEVWLNNLMYQYVYDAKRRGLDFALTREEFDDLISKKCHYCGGLPSNLKSTRTLKRSYNGIDRMNNKLGYAIANCVSCCYQCNWAKGNMSLDEFYSWIKSVADKAGFQYKTPQEFFK